MKKELLLVVDVQNGFINRQTEHVVEPISEFVAKWQGQAKGPVIYSRFINLDGSPWEKILGYKDLKAEPSTALSDKLPTKGTHIFKKGTYSAWSKEVQQVADGTSIKRVVLCGIDTDQCVLETAIDIFEANLVPVVLEDLCASGAGKDFHRAGIKLLKRLIGDKQVISSKDYEKA
jgi:nicotinamidase-related amidase